MTKKALKGLKASIRKWKKIVNETGVDEGTYNCPLCKLFYDDCCTGCPVEEKTGKVGCAASVYDDWSFHQYYDHGLSHHSDAYKIECSQCKDLAKQELAFLKSLLPKRKKLNVK